MFGAGIKTGGYKSNRQVRRDAEAALKSGTYAWMILLAALVEAGGELTVSQRTIESVGRRLHSLDFALIPDTAENPGTFTIRLIGETDGVVPEKQDHQPARTTGGKCTIVTHPVDEDGSGDGEPESAAHEADLGRLADDGGPAVDHSAE